MIAVGDCLELRIDKPAAGGRMIARHDGRVVLVAGAIPGERVSARVERLERRLAFASVADVLEPSPDRREAPADPGCGGCTYGHVVYERQLALKGEVVADAFARLARLPLDAPVAIDRSPETAYRMRAMFHVRGPRAGFYREGTHELCDAAATGQLHPDAGAAVSRLAAGLDAADVAAVSLEMADTLDGRSRAVHVEASSPAPDPEVLARLLEPALTSLSLADADRRRVGVGPVRIVDSLEQLSHGRAVGLLARTAESFFQANRFLLPDLVVAVLDAVVADGDVLDLYAGAGLFAMALAGSGRGGITAVEGAGASGADLEHNAGTAGGRVAVALSSVERYLSRRALPPSIIVDPPRTGLSRQALQALCGARPHRLVYVSCDPATLARDSRGLVDGGYRLRSLRGFDLFPNTPHVETMAVFEGS